MSRERCRLTDHLVATLGVAVATLMLWLLRSDRENTHRGLLFLLVAAAAATGGRLTRARDRPRGASSFESVATLQVKHRTNTRGRARAVLFDALLGRCWYFPRRPWWKRVYSWLRGRRYDDGPED